MSAKHIHPDNNPLLPPVLYRPLPYLPYRIVNLLPYRPPNQPPEDLDKRPWRVQPLHPEPY
jgi:hypothetical protein